MNSLFVSLAVTKRHGLCALLAGCMILAAAPVMAQQSCNPLVRLDVTDASLAKTLATLSEEHGFGLTFPQSMDRTVSLSEQLPLNRLVEKLTRGTSTTLVYRELPGCDQPALARVDVYPEGEEVTASRSGSHSEPLSMSSPQSVSAPLVVSEPQAPPEYIYIDNMEQYVEEVLLRKRRPELARMTPEQQVQYRHARKKVKAILEPQLKDGTLKREKRRKVADKTAGTAGTTEH